MATTNKMMRSIKQFSYQKVIGRSIIHLNHHNSCRLMESQRIYSKILKRSLWWHRRIRPCKRGMLKSWLLWNTSMTTRNFCAASKMTKSLKQWGLKIRWIVSSVRCFQRKGRCMRVCISRRWIGTHLVVKETPMDTASSSLRLLNPWFSTKSRSSLISKSQLSHRAKAFKGSNVARCTWTKTRWSEYYVPRKKRKTSLLTDLLMASRMTKSFRASTIASPAHAMTNSRTRIDQIRPLMPNKRLKKMK